MFEESDPRHKRKRGSNGASTVLQRVVWIERAMAFRRAGRPDFIAAAVAPVQNGSARQRLRSNLTNWMGQAPQRLHAGYSHSEQARTSKALGCLPRGQHEAVGLVVVQMFNARRAKGEMVTA